MSTVLDGSVAVLWGSATKELNWVHLSPKHGRTSVARAFAGGFWVRDMHGDCPHLTEVAAAAYAAWYGLHEGEDKEEWATHRLVPPVMQEIERIPKVDS